MSGWTVIWAGVAVGGASFGSWGLVRKGENQVLIRTSVILTMICCYLMWSIIYLAQLHPLIKPKRGDLRPE
ncbi:hypothetical protein BCV69DRAFT_280047 [Microstroma glucosiphilum]|uniref:Uncharacterized protein n=1 Tax=Pseudomicrostroma glucosiphilum TaxID=1684307 RepID=A0A316ULR9_9BASI|nr:hypothetical protein BCV69DRAFT_280047 [Pseudomicrostroma glucosiphilum]PWN24145.1 hypothetical protein BCV69DRAFT_280047 [Pseudomicrostroma glucosiphilum]